MPTQINGGPCKIAGCPRASRQRRLCPRHYERLRTNGDPLGASPHERHGMSTSLTYGSWRSMKWRCLNPRSNRFHRYGGRGIRVHADWLHSFAAFLRDVGPRPSRRHTLDRINNNGHYEPGNCRWATAKQQTANRRPRAA